ncbi:MAG TPA: VOC family protein [Cytophagales bacterium]|nr:VOC family protein [Cytophagales bacterium]
MNINHVALWVSDLEKMRQFYIKFFQGTSNEKYTNPIKKFQSYFISFPSGARLELMHSPQVNKSSGESNKLGYAHLAFSVGSKEKVDEFTKMLEGNGFEVIGGPRVTGDGYYESTILDPENNIIEITI